MNYPLSSSRSSSSYHLVESMNILTQLDTWRSRPNPSIISSIPEEVTLADYYFGRSWKGSINISSGVDNFRPSVLIWFIRTYRIGSLLDADVGRGNRLIACLMQQVKYIGISSYLPMNKVFSRVVQAFGVTSDVPQMIYGSFNDIPIGEYGVDAIFLGISERDSDTRVCNWMIKAWNNLDQGKIMLVYSESFSQHLRLLTSQVTSTLLGVEQSSEKLFDLDSRSMKLRVWRKMRPNDPSPYDNIELVRDTYRFGATSLMRRAMRSYVRSLGSKVHYLCSSFIPDVVSVDLAEEIPIGNLTLYVSNEKRYDRLIKTLTSLGHSVQKYAGDSNQIRDDLTEKLTPRDELLPAQLDSPLFEACLVQALRISLPQDSGELIAPERIWIETDYLVLIGALLYVWTETTLLISLNGSVERMKRMIPLVLRGRVILHKKEYKSDVKSMRAKYGYETDALMLA